ncbi:unnamed protein product [Acanthoscelides obtectus]|uniref:Uncharacterized protein n=1 Tax=Acanthoscelides obtectus TaxID=200917 RepID=A0A9P0NXF9_ACAOB|nr:unnamed protein product [Acanthoscelides obtectus]CAK1627885.1 hypothetical protein AOBTE_LOCUS4885 [Acanthoscelides obtectus]
MLASHGEDSPCSGQGCLKRSAQEEGPFWANRGKRDPLLDDRLCWIFVRQSDLEFEPPGVPYRKHELRMRDRRAKGDDLPFYAARGKKQRSKHDNQL